jgi:hypothetical protein
MYMDVGLLSVALWAVGGVFAATIAWLISWQRQRRRVEEAAEWPSVEARIESGALEATLETNKVRMPTFAFSYEVSGNYYSGRFSLMPKGFPSEADTEPIIERMKGRKLELRYDPNHPEVWRIPNEFIDGYKVEQKIGMHVVHSLYPRD